MNFTIAMMALALITALQPALIAQAHRPDLRKQWEEGYLTRDLALDSTPVQGSLALLLGITKRPGGIVVLSDCDGGHPSPLLIHAGASLSSALDLLVAVHPTYFWTIRDGVVNLFPKQDRAAVMDVRIGRFEWDTTSSYHLTVDQLSKAETLQRYFAAMRFTAGIDVSLGLQPAPRIVDGKVIPGPIGHRYSVANEALLSVLNAVVASYGEGTWYYEQRSCAGRTTYSLSIR